jgi:cell division protein FtsB
MLDERIPPFKEGELQITTAERIVTNQIGDNVTLRAENESLKAEIADLQDELKLAYQAEGQALFDAANAVGRLDKLTAENNALRERLRIGGLDTLR